MEDRQRWMERTLALAVENVIRNEGGPFAALVVCKDELIASGANSVTRLNDPTAHAEIVAIRAACQVLGTFELKDCEIYCSCEPCPMCLGALYWARPGAFYYSACRADAAKAGFDDELIYREIDLAPENRDVPGFRLLPEQGGLPFTAWARQENKKLY